VLAPSNMKAIRKQRTRYCSPLRLAPLFSPHPHSLPHWTGQGSIYLVGLIPVSQTDSTRPYSSPRGWRQQAPAKLLWTCTRLRGAASQKTAIFILAAVTTWNLTQKWRLRFHKSGTVSWLSEQLADSRGLVFCVELCFLNVGVPSSDALSGLRYGSVSGHVSDLYFLLYRCFLFVNTEPRGSSPSRPLSADAISLAFSYYGAVFSLAPLPRIVMSRTLLAHGPTTCLWFAQPPDVVFRA
jgi:hypothetical protein